MEKTTTIRIGGMQFSLTESAYAKLHSYLERLTAHFASEAESAEIIRDIESRIAEKLAHKKHEIVSEADVTAVIAEIGEASEFEDDEAEPVRGRKHLYRDTENGWIAGVCSGLGNYFDVDPLWLRLAFLVSLFFGGAGILLYIILWILIPEAKTSGQKLEMKGHPVNLEGIARVVREGIEDAQKSGAPKRFFRGIGRVVHGFFRIVGKLAGSLIVVGSFFATIGLLVGSGILVTNWNAPYNDFPLRGVVPDTLLFSGVAAGFIAILIPLVFLFSLGIRLISRKNILPSFVGFGLVGLWAIAVSAAGTVAVTSAGKFYEYQRTNPEYQVETRSIEAPSFSTINTNGVRVTIKKGDVQAVEISGRTIERDNTIVEVIDGTLVINRKDYDGAMCIFCNDDPAEVMVTTPDMDAMAIENATVWFDEYTDTNLSIEMLRGVIRGTLAVDTLIIKSDGGSFRANVTTDALTINAENAHFNIDGSATTATMTLENVSMEATGFTIRDATITTDSSFLQLNVTGSLTTNDDNSSRVTNASNRIR